MIDSLKKLDQLCEKFKYTKEQQLILENKKYFITDSIPFSTDDKARYSTREGILEQINSFSVEQDIGWVYYFSFENGSFILDRVLAKKSLITQS